MELLNFPPASLPIYETDNGPVVFDRIRRRRVALTPEEWVRQHLVHFLIDHRGYSPALMTVEGQITVNRMRRRVDVICRLTAGQPWLVAECKAPSVGLSQQVLDQALRYNLVLDARFVLITNGLNHVCFEMPREGNGAAVVPDIPYSPYYQKK